MISRVLSWAFALFLLLVGGALLIGGARLILLEGSFYYAAAGLALIATAALIVLRGPWAPRIYGAFLGLTVIWAVTEAGFDGWALTPRLAAFAVIGLWMIAPWTRAALKREGASLPWLTTDGATAGAVAAAVLVMLIGAFSGYPSRPLPADRPAADLGAPATDWASYGSTVGGTRYSQVDQITPENVNQLEEVWRFRTGSTGFFKNIPLQVGDLLYVCAAYNIVIALDAETGEERWRHDPDNAAKGGFGYTQNCRGVAYHEAPTTYRGECPARIIVGLTDARLIAFDALTGEACEGFGLNGSVNLRTGMGEHGNGDYYPTSPPVIAGDVAAIGGWVADSQRYGMPSGVVRGFDVYSGAFRWAWDMGRPGEHGEPTGGETYARGTPNVWSAMSYDPQLDLIYAPTGNPSPDYYGAYRTPEMEQFNSSIVALDGDTGELVWSFQTVHHDIWDYDVPAQPVLIDLPQEDGSVLPALAAATKRGEIFLLDRRNGEPIAAVEERPVPQGGLVEGEWVSETQPFSAEMPHFRDDLRERDMWGVTPLDQLWCRITFRSLRYEGHFTPPTEGGSIQFPGNAGGFNWGAVAVDAENGLLVAAPMVMANQINMVDRSPGEDAEGPFADRRLFTGLTRPFLSPLEVPCAEPPFGEIAVIDLHTFETVWRRPLGSARETGPFGIALGLDLPVGNAIYGGPMVTAGGVAFHAAAMDHALRAFDVRTGELLWRADLPGSNNATPMSYAAPRSGRQMVVVTVPSPTWRYPRGLSGVNLEEDPEGGYVIAYALPEQ